jgi:hypothetical protein
MVRRIASVISLVALMCGAPAYSQRAQARHDEPRAQDNPAKGADETVAKGADESVLASATEDAQPRHGSVTTAKGVRIDYVVTPGTLTIRNDAGEPIASMFYVAYTAPRARDGRERPVTFLFNGGPGSSSMWLHMGSWGPIRVDTPTPTAYAPAPFNIGENRLTLLDDSDLVFIDAVGTGLSRAVGKAKPQDFYGVDPDIDAFARAIQRYLTLNDRWNSPKFMHFSSAESKRMESFSSRRSSTMERASRGSISPNCASSRAMPRQPGTTTACKTGRQHSNRSSPRCATGPVVPILPHSRRATIFQTTSVSRSRSR